MLMYLLRNKGNIQRGSVLQCVSRCFKSFSTSLEQKGMPLTTASLFVLLSNCTKSQLSLRVNQPSGPHPYLSGQWEISHHLKEEEDDWMPKTAKPILLTTCENQTQFKTCDKPTESRYSLSASALSPLNKLPCLSMFKPWWINAA